VKPILAQNATAQNVTAIKKPDDKQFLQLEDAAPPADSNDTLIIQQDFLKVPAAKATAWKPKPGMIYSAFSYMTDLVAPYMNWGHHN